MHDLSAGDTFLFQTVSEGTTSGGTLFCKSGTMFLIDCPFIIGPTMPLKRMVSIAMNRD